MNAASPPSSVTTDSAPDREELAALRASVARVLESECDSRSLHTFFDGKSNLDLDVWSRASDLGWMAAALPLNWGGLGLGPVGLQMIHGECGRRAAPGPFIATLSAGQWIAEVGTTSHQSKYLPLICSGDLTAAVPALIGSGAPFTLKGSCIYGQAEMLGAPTAGLVVLPVGSAGSIDAWALLQPDGMSAVLSRREYWDRTREICRFKCKGANAVGVLPDPDGAIGLRLRRHIALALAADSLGGAANILHQTVEYLKLRIQFERPIASFQAIKHRAVDLLVSLETQRYVLDQAVECAVVDSADADMWAALAKAGATRAYAAVAGDCIQLHGGVGHTWEFDAHIYAKRARLNEALASDNRAMCDFAADGLAAATGAGRPTTELHA